MELTRGIGNRVSLSVKYEFRSSPQIKDMRLKSKRGRTRGSMVIIAAWVLVWANVFGKVRSEKATVTCSVSGSNNQILEMTLNVIKEYDVITAATVYTAKEDDATLSKPIENDNCRVDGNGEETTPFTITVSFDATLINYPCGIAVINIYEYRLRLRTFEHPDVKSTNDVFLDAVCDRSAGSQTLNILPQPAFVPPESKLLKIELLSNQSAPVTSVNLGESVYFKAEYYFNNEYRVGTCGYDFWVALPQDSDPFFDFTHYLIATHRQSDSVNVSYVNSSGIETTLNFVLNFSQEKLGIAAHTGVERVSNKSVHITSSHQICVQSFNYLTVQSTTIFTIFPTNSLGKEYIINKLFKSNTVVILAIDRETDITLHGDVEKVDIPSSLTGLVPFESLQIVAKEDVTKLRIISTKPVAVFMGSQKTDSNPDGFAEQLSDTTSMGFHFLFFPAYGEIVCTSLTANTVLNYVCNDGSSEEKIIQQLESTVFTSSSLQYCIIESSAPLSCGQYFRSVVNGPVKGYASLSPRAQWSTHYTFGAFVNVEYEIVIVIEDGYQNGLNISGTFAGVMEGSSLSWTSVVRHSGITYVAVNFQIGKLFGPVVQISHPSKPFLTLLRDNRELSVTIPPKAFLTNVWKCSKTLGFSGDLVDSDCDGSADEDRDITTGSEPYDLAGNPQGLKPAGEIRFANCIAKSNNKWADGGPVIPFIDENGCPVDSDLFSINATFFEMTTNRLHYPRLFSSGYLESARFSGSTDVYFRCQVLLCYDNTGRCFENACGVGSGYIGNKFDRMYVEQKLKVLYSTEKPLHRKREDTSRSVPETSTDTYVIICVTSFIPLVLSLAVTLVLYRKFLFLIDETMCQSTGGLQLGSNNNRL